MSTAYSILRQAIQTERSDEIERAVKDWLSGLSTTEELHDVVAAHICTPKPDEPSTTQAISAKGVS